MVFFPAFKMQDVLMRRTLGVNAWKGKAAKFNARNRKLGACWRRVRAAFAIAPVR